MMMQVRNFRGVVLKAAQSLPITKRGLKNGTKRPLLSSNRAPSFPRQLCTKLAYQHSTSSRRAASSSFINSNFLPGPPLRLGTGRIANLTASSVVGTCGNTVVLAAVAAETTPDAPTSFLTVDYRQRTAAVGKFPQHNARRSDSGRPTDAEILCGRAIDRALRPLLAPYHPVDGTIAQYHVQVTVQAAESTSISGGGGGVATALNTAVASVVDVLRQPLAATVLTVRADGSVSQQQHCSDVTTTTTDIDTVVVGELLYAGTRERAVMMEWTSYGGALPEVDLERVLALAHATIQPTIDTIVELQELRNSRRRHETETMALDDEGREVLRKALGLGVDSPEGDMLATKEEETVSGSASDATEESRDKRIKTMLELMQYREQVLHDVVQYGRETLGSSLHRVFGYSPDSNVTKDGTVQHIHIHKDTSSTLLSKRYRGQREQVIQEEIQRLVTTYLEEQDIQFDLGNVSDEEEEQAAAESKSLHLKGSDRTWIHEQAVYKLLRRALWETATQYGTRSDNRTGNSIGQAWKTIRPLSMTVPALPDAVHGSALFARGDTQVLCTTTLGAPRDGPPLSDPFVAAAPSSSSSSIMDQPIDENDPGQLPVGSLRFLRTQEAMESDLNSRKAKADRERTGDSGSLAEKKRAFLQYDFPSYSTGVISNRKGGIDRRAVGHGALAERAVIPVLPDAEAFPYSIRMTSEVTDSNGSSSMASVCGSTLALLDAGVPMKDTVAGVSVGLAVKHDDVEHNADSPDVEPDEFSLLLDITGTEDHYGGMDFKVAGTRDGVTAIQLDVKRPLPQKVLFDALRLANLGRAGILDSMSQQSQSAFGKSGRRDEPKSSAPRVEVIHFDPNRKRDLVGPGGVVLRQLEERYGVEIDLTQEGKCLLFGPDRAMVQKARATVMDLVSNVVEGEVYTGTVIDIKDFGAIVELLRNKEGLLHVSELTLDQEEMKTHPDGIAGFVRKELRIGDKIELLCIGVDVVQGTVRLSRKALLQREQEQVA